MTSDIGLSFVSGKQVLAVHARSRV